MTNPFWIPLLQSLLAGAATAIGGALVYCLGRSPSDPQLCFSLALAGSVMITVSVFDMLYPSCMSHGFLSPCATAVAGAAAFGLLSKLFPEPSAGDLWVLPMTKLDPDHPHAEARARAMRLGLILFLSLTAHNFPEGLAVSVSGVESTSHGSLVAIAIAAHNIPEGLAIATPIFAATKSGTYAIGLALLSGLSEPLGAIFALTILRPVFTSWPWVIDYVLCFVAGVMTAAATIELLPEAIRYKAPKHLWSGIIIGFIGMLATIWVLSPSDQV